MPCVEQRNVQATSSIDDRCGVLDHLLESRERKLIFFLQIDQQNCSFSVHQRSSGYSFPGKRNNSLPTALRIKTGGTPAGAGMAQDASNARRGVS
jgi:hypothetical protein